MHYRLTAAWRKRLVLAGFALYATCPHPVPAADDAAAARELGQRVLAIQQALADPGAPGSLGAVVELGTDSRYYLMVRGWLVQQRLADQSLLEATAGRGAGRVSRRIEFIDRAIRAIDLE